MVDAKIKNNLYKFHLVINIIFLFLITFSSYIHTPLHSITDYLMYGSHLLLLQFCVFGFIYILSLNRIVFTILFPPIFLVLCIIAFWSYSLDISFSDGIVQATIETKPDVVFDLINLPLILYCIISVVFLIVILKYYNQIKVNLFNGKLILLSLLAIALFFVVESKRTGTLKSRLPFNVYFELVNYLKKSDYTYTKINSKINSETKNLNVYLILGESVRADHLSLNGYNRLTNPLLAQQQNVLSFSNAYTNKLYTAVSLPQMLSNQSIYDSIEQLPNYTITDVLKAAQVNTRWIGNQTPEKGYTYFIDNCNQKTFIDPLHSIYSFNKTSDTELLNYINDNSNIKENNFSIFHMIGSHWYYENRYTEKFKKFTPTIKSKYIPSNTKEEMINSYDNTIVFLDYFLNAFVETVKKRNELSVVLYISDHGELLGENNKWLHAQATNEVGIHNPAFILWYSDQFKQKYPNEIKFLESKQKKQFTLDVVYPTILDLYKIDTSYYNKKESLFNE